jgi:peptide deformylase
MAVLPILTWPDPRLTQVCAPALADAATRQLAADLLETMYAAPGRGLAAPQVGALVRLFVMDTTWKEGVLAPRIVLNPEILWRSDQTATGPEGCLSIRGGPVTVTRPTAIRMRWHDLEGEAHDEVLTRFDAVCALHEADHLDGILTLDHLSAEDRARAEAGAQP